MHLAVDMWHWNNPTHFIFKQTKNVKYIFFFTEDKGNWFLEKKNYGLGEEEVLFVYLGG